VFGLDDRIAELSHGGGVGLALAVALLLGLRHATDPDHLTAVSTLVLSDARRGTRRAVALGLAWGGGHAVALIAVGVPLVLFDHLLPAPVQTGAEVAIAVVIVALAVRLLVRWRRGYFHAHPHWHGTERHSHPHAHEHGGASERSHEHSGGNGHVHSRADDAAGHAHEHAFDPDLHDHEHADALGRSPAGAFGIGLVHGIGGSAGAGLLLVAAVPGRTAGVVALAVFAAAAAVSMAACSAGFGHVLARGPVAGRLVRLVPAFGVCGVLFGLWYGLGALETVPYVF
jgi:ABC-type nickel/cobalt efflux system permease component RcnA